MSSTEVHSNATALTVGTCSPAALALLPPSEIKASRVTVRRKLLSEPLGQGVAQGASFVLVEGELAAAVDMRVELDLAVALGYHEVGEARRALVHRARGVEHCAAFTGSLRRDIVGAVGHWTPRGAAGAYKLMRSPRGLS